MNPIVRRIISVVSGAIAIGVCSASIGYAQDANNTTGCPLEPLSLPLWGGTPAAEVAASPAAIAGVGGIDEAEIEAALEAIVACINTGEPQLMFAIYTDRYLAEQYADPATTYLPEFEQRLAQNAPEPADQFALESIDSVEALDDGRVRVAIRLSSGASTFKDTLILANQDGTWLVDGIDSLDPPA